MCVVLVMRIITQYPPSLRGHVELHTEFIALHDKFVKQMRLGVSLDLLCSRVFRICRTHSAEHH